MSCTPGCCDSPAEHYASLNVANPNAPKNKSTVDDHGTHRVEVIESANRQDVAVTLLAPVKAAPHAEGA